MYSNRIQYTISHKHVTRHVTGRSMSMHHTRREGLAGGPHPHHPSEPIQSRTIQSNPRFTTHPLPPPHPHKKPHHDASPHGGVWRGPCGVPTPSTGHDSKRVPPLSRPRLLSTIGGVRGVWMMDDPDAIANAVDAARDASSSSSHLGASFPLSRERITRTRCTPPPRR